MRAEAAGDPGPWRQQAILGPRPMGRRCVAADVVRDYVVEHLAADDAVLVIDETGFLKQGRASCGVSRPYPGLRREGHQLSRSACSPPMSRATVMHSSTGLCICREPGRLTRPGWQRRMGYADGTTFATKPALAVEEMIERAIAAGVPFALELRPTASMGSAMSRWSCGAPARATCLALRPASNFRSWQRKAADRRLRRKRSRALSIPRDGNTACPAGDGTRRAAAAARLGVLRTGRSRTLPNTMDARTSGLWTRGLLIHRNIADGDLAFFSCLSVPSRNRHRDAGQDRGTSVGRSKIWRFETMAKTQVGPRPQREAYAPALGTAGIAMSRSSCSPSPWWPPFGIAQ